MNKATVSTPDGQTIEVELSAIKLPEGVQVIEEGQVPAGYVKQEVMDASIEKRLQRHKSSLKKDAEYIREIIEENVQGIQFDDNGRPVVPKASKEVDIDALREQIIREVKTPLEGELSTLKQSNTRLLESKRRGDIMQAAIKYGVREDMLKPVSTVPGAPSFWENMVAGQYGYSPEHDAFAVSEGEGFALNPNGTREMPLLTIDAHMALLKKDPAYSNFFKVEGQKGSNFSQDAGSPAVGGNVSRDAFSTGSLSGDQLEKIAKGELSVV